MDRKFARQELNGMKTMPAEFPCSGLHVSRCLCDFNRMLSYCVLQSRASEIAYWFICNSFCLARVRVELE